MGDFFLTLPSNSSKDIYPDNTPGHFYTKLPQTYNLSSAFEIGLAEISFPNTYSNVQQDLLFFYQHDYEDSLNIYHLPRGLYSSPTTIIKELNKLIENRKRRNKTKFSYNPATRRTTLYVYKDEVISLTPDLGKFLNLPSFNMKGPATYVSRGDVAVHENSQSIFVYCDLVTHRQVGDVMVPLLRAIPTIDKTNSVIHQIYEKPHYQPLSRSTFSTVEILIANDLGDTPHFDGDIKTVVTLHLRPRKT